MRTTLGHALDSTLSRIPEILNIASTDARCLTYINMAERRMLVRGKYWGTTASYSVSAQSQFFTLPPFLDTAETFAIGKQPLPIHDATFQFLKNGWGVRDLTQTNGSGVVEVMEVGYFSTSVDIPTATPSTVTVKCDVALDVGKSVLILGYDSNNNWVRTLVAGVWQDGETILLAQGAGTNSATTFSKITGVQPPNNLSGQWWLYAGGIAGTLLSNYQWWELSPNYKRYQIPFINSTITTVDVFGKKAWYPVKNNSDYLPVSNLDALTLAVRAIRAEENSDWVAANLLWNGGVDKKSGIGILGVVQELDFELSHHEGSGLEYGINVVGSSPGATPLPVLL